MSVLKKYIALTLCIALCLSCIPMTASAARDFSFETELADSLYALNLFKGTGNSYALESPLTRPDSVIMLLRLYGELNNAKAYSKTHPFTDVPSYADLYISYAKDNGLAYGRSDTLFGSENVTAAGYLTFVLRALGYSDKGGKDFTWDNPFTLADEVGILPTCVDVTNFLRADVVSISYAALAANMADGSGTLADKLIAEGLFTQEAFDANYDPKAFAPKPTKPVLDSEQVYAKCSSSVFRIDVYDAHGTAFASGSGFFIDKDGTAVTNYHVLDGAHSATITLTNGDVYNILGVYDYDKTNDWAVVQVECGDYNCLTIGDKSTIVGGAKVYALGSPLGLDDTFSDGMISNANRVVDDVNYIQISAPISHGSSGGALINKYGEVIGICSAGFVDGQNLNLAIPITAIDGYSHYGITFLKDVFGATAQPTSRQQLAFDTLVTAINEIPDGIDENGGTYFYILPDDYTRVFFTDYTDLYGQVEIYLEYTYPDDDVCYISKLYLGPDGNEFDFYVSILQDSTQTAVFEAMQWLTPPDTEIYYDEYYIADGYDVDEALSVGQEDGYAMLLDTLEWLDAFYAVIYEELGYPLYSTSDFGF